MFVGALHLTFRVNTMNLRAQVLVHRLIVTKADIVRLLLLVTVTAQRITHRILRCRRHHWRRRTTGRWSTHRIRRCTGSLFRCIHVRLFLSFSDILLVSNTLITKPIANLRDLKQTKKRTHTHHNKISIYKTMVSVIYIRLLIIKTLHSHISFHLYT